MGIAADRVGEDIFGETSPVLVQAIVYRILQARPSEKDGFFHRILANSVCTRMR